MPPIPSFFFIALLLLFFIHPAAAEVSVTFADLNIVKGFHVLVYNNTGAFIGEYNTTASLSLDPSQSYMFVFKPTEQSWFSDPLNTLNLFTVALPVMLSYLLWVVVIVGTVFIITRIWK